MLTYLSNKPGKATLKVSGNVLDVIKGVVSDNSLAPIDTNKLDFGLGAGTFSTKEHVGETIIFSGAPYVSWEDKNQIHTQSQSPVHSPFIMGIDSKSSGGVLLDLCSKAPVTLQSLYETFALNYPEGFAIVLYAKCFRLDSTYVKTPPIYSENINELHEKYWAGKKQEKQQPACFFAVVMPFEAQAKFPSKELSHAFYNNPMEVQTTPLLSHTHGMLLPSEIKSASTEAIDSFLQSIVPRSSIGVRHVLTSTLLLNACFALFPIEKITVSSKEL